MFSYDHLEHRLDTERFKQLEYRGIIHQLLYQHQPGTLKRYLFNLRLFMRFIKQEWIKDAGECDICIIYINNWIDSQPDATTKCKQDVKLAQQIDDVDTDGVEDILDRHATTKAYRDATVLLASFMDPKTGENLEAKVVTTARNHLMTLLNLANNQKAGIIIGITMQEFNNRKVSGDEEAMTLSFL